MQKMITFVPKYSFKVKGTKAIIGSSLVPNLKTITALTQTRTKGHLVKNKNCVDGNNNNAYISSKVGVNDNGQAFVYKKNNKSHFIVIGDIVHTKNLPPNALKNKLTQTN